jgi:hypothetical protein
MMRTSDYALMGIIIGLAMFSFGTATHWNPLQILILALLVSASAAIVIEHLTFNDDDEIIKDSKIMKFL